MKSISAATLNQVIEAQRNEVTEYHLYKKLARGTKDESNRLVLNAIADDELRHYKFWMKFSGLEVEPNYMNILRYYWISRIFGLTFGLKLMEKGEEKAEQNYRMISVEIPEALKLSAEENDHEKELLKLINEERLKYTGSIVLGLNDALVEILGTLAGLTLALQNNKLVALTGIIAGIAGALSMSSSEYLSHKSEGNEKGAIKPAIYTGMAYIIAVVFLVTPYLLISSPWLSLAIAITNSIILVMIFSYYISVVNEQSFRKRFLEMVILSTFVALLSFGLGYIVKQIFGIEI